MKVFETIGKGLAKGASNALKIAVPVAELYFVAKWLGYTKPEHKTIKFTSADAPTYSEAVKAIVKRSNMFSSSIEKCLAALKTDGTAEYYSAIISIAESDMFDSTKVRLITKLKY